MREAAEAQGYRHQDIISGAGHDAVYMARVAPTAMIFVPCVGGISHNEIEDAKPEDLTAGCNVLLNALLETADAADRRCRRLGACGQYRAPWAAQKILASARRSALIWQAEAGVSPARDRPPGG